MKNKILLVYVSILIIFATFSPDPGQIATSPSYTLEQSVIGGGGGKTNSVSFMIDGTIGQSLAGTQSTSTTFGVRGGFWQAVFAPTAALVTVSGRVVTSDGTPIRGVRLTLFDMAGNVHQSISNEFGYFQFDSVEAGQTYLLSATSKRFIFATQPVTVEDQITQLNVTAVP